MPVVSTLVTQNTAVTSGTLATSKDDVATPSRPDPRPRIPTLPMCLLQFAQALGRVNPALSHGIHAGEPVGEQCRDNKQGEIAPWHGEPLGRRIEYSLQHSYQHLCDDGAEDEPDDGAGA